MRFTSSVVYALALIVLCASSALAAAPQAFDIDPAVMELLNRGARAYRKMQAIRHTDTYEWRHLVIRADNPSNERLRTGLYRYLGVHEWVGYDTPAKYTLTLVRPNKFRLESSNSPRELAVCDGAHFMNFRALTGEYVKDAAPATFNDFQFGSDIPVGSQTNLLVMFMLQGNVRDNPVVSDILPNAKLGKPDKIFDVVDVRYADEANKHASCKLFFSKTTHLLVKSILTRDTFQLVETMGDVQIDKPIDPTLFKFTPPKLAKRVETFTDPEVYKENQRKALAARYEKKLAPDFTAQDQDGTPIKLSALTQR